MLSKEILIECEMIQKMGEWLNAHGHSYDLKDCFWMEQYMHDFKMRDVIDLMYDYHKDMVKQKQVDTAKVLGFTHE